MPRGKESEIKVARGRLAGALKEQVPASSSDEAGAHSSDTLEDPLKLPKEHHSILRQSQLLFPKSNKKLMYPGFLSNDSFVIKLFDRSLDLCKYDDKTSLYPICRAWMLNTPRSRNIKSFRRRRTPSPTKRELQEDLLEKLETGLISEVRSLPKPREVDISPIPETPKTKVVDFELDFKPITKNDLLAEHKLKWKKTRSNWIKHVTEYNKQKYEPSFQIIDAMQKK